MDAMEIHTIQVYPYRARACQCPCISTQSESMPWMQTTLVFCVRAGSRLCQCPWKSTHLCSAMDAMETHTSPVYPYRARVCQCPWTSTNLCSAMDAMEIHTIQAYPYRARVCQCPCISTQSVSMPWMQTTLVFCVRVGARLCEAVWSFFNDYLFPHMKAHGIPTCSDNLEFVKASSVTARDTAWLLDRMARVNDRSSPDVEVELLRAQAQGQGSVHKDVVQETHQAIAQVFFSSVGLSVCLWTYFV